MSKGDFVVIADSSSKDIGDVGIIKDIMRRDNNGHDFVIRTSIYRPDLCFKESQLRPATEEEIKLKLENLLLV